MNNGCTWRPRKMQQMAWITVYSALRGKKILFGQFSLGCRLKYIKMKFQQWWFWMGDKLVLSNTREAVRVLAELIVTNIYYNWLMHKFTLRVFWNLNDRYSLMIQLKADLVTKTSVDFNSRNNLLLQKPDWEETISCSALDLHLRFFWDFFFVFVVYRRGSTDNR